MNPQQTATPDSSGPVRRGKAIFRIVVWALVYVLFLLGITVVGARLYLGKSIQPRSGVVEVPGLSAPVTIAFDDWAIPRIRAENELDAIRAQGFIHASERLWQLEMYQRVAQGRLAELFGEPAIGADKLLRTLDFWGAATREMATLPESMLDTLRAYAEGVNARLASWRGPWPPEFVILGIEPQPWTPQASLSISRSMTFDLSKWQGELDRIEALARLPETHRPALTPRYPAWGPTILQDRPGEPGMSEETGSAASAENREAVFPDAYRIRLAQTAPAPRKPLDPLGLLAGLGLTASNSWAIGPSRTADGYPLLANDTHLNLRAPSTWYLNAISVEDSDHHVAGFSIPGAHSVVIGLSRHIAWGFTNGSIDGADFIAETIGEDGGSYLDGSVWRPLEVRRERIGVRGREQPLEWDVRRTVRGPIITDVIPAGGLVLSMLWTGFLERGPFQSLVNMNHALTIEEMDVAARGFSQPHQNLIYASASGRLGYRLTGSVPLRPAGTVGATVLSPEVWPHGWAENRNEDLAPAWIDPPSDYLITANNLQSWAVFGRIGQEYLPPFRARRIHDVLSNASGWTVDDTRNLQLDSQSLWAGLTRQQAVDAARRIGAEELATVLEGWDLATEPRSLGPAPFFAWLYRLRALIVVDELGEDAAFPAFAFLQMLEEGDAPGTQLSLWADDVRTPEIETLAQWEEEAARTAAGLAEVRWGEARFERSAHPLGSVKMLDRLFSLHVGPYPARGGPYTLRAADRSSWSPLDSTSWSIPWIGEAGVSQRFVARMAPQAPRGYFFLPTGQSGNPLDRHYRDMAARWGEGFLVEISPGEELTSPEYLLELYPGRKP